MRQLSTDHLAAWLAPHDPPCVSLYQPTHRHYPENKQDLIRYRSLVRRLEESLSRKYSTGDFKALLERFHALARDDRFWKRRTEGLAVLASSEGFEVFDLPRPVRELVVVADSFHTKPMLRMLQSADRYHILGLTRHQARLYEGDRDGLDEVELTKVPSTIVEALGAELTEAHQTVASYGGVGGDSAMHHGHGHKKDEVEVDMTRFFRVIDRGILEHHSKPSGLPLMLAALTEHHAPFRDVSHNPFLMEVGIAINPDALDLEELRALAWQKVQPRYLERLADLVERYHLACSKGAGSDDLATVAEATIGGRVATLLVEADRVIPGRIDPVAGLVLADDLADPEIDDVLDDLAENVLRKKGDVVVVPRDRMPTGTGVAATFRF